MTDAELIDLVRRCRAKQRAFFRTPAAGSVEHRRLKAEAIDLEKRVDAELERRERPSLTDRLRGERDAEGHGLGEAG